MVSVLGLLASAYFVYKILREKARQEEAERKLRRMIYLTGEEEASEEEAPSEEERGMWMRWGRR